MVVYQDFLATISVNPPFLKLIWADWLEEQGNSVFANALRAVNCVLPLTNDWLICWTGQDMSHPTEWSDLENNKVEQPNPATIDAVLLAWLEVGVCSGCELCGVFHLTDGRWVRMRGNCDTTGWGLTRFRRCRDSGQFARFIGDGVG